MRIPLKQTISQHKLLLLSFVFFFLFSGMVSVFADENSGGYAPGESLNPTCAPNTSDCLVVTGWQLNTVDNYVFNTTDLVGIGTNTPDVELDVVGGVNFLNTTADSSSSFVHGDVAALGGAGSAGSYSFVSQEVFDIDTLGYQLLSIDNADNILARTFIRNAGADLEFNMYTGDGDTDTLGVQTFIELQAEDSNAVSDSYLELHTNGEINLYSNPDVNISAGLDFDDDGEVSLYSNIDETLGISAGITLNGPSALYPGSLSAYATNASDINAYFALDPDFLTSIGVDDEDDDGSYSVTMSPDYNTGITISHTDTTLGLVDVGTLYWGTVGSASIRDRVVTQATSDTDFLMNETRLDSSGLHFTYQSASGILTPISTGSFVMNDDFDWIGTTTSFTNTLEDLSGDRPANLFDTTITLTGNETSTSYKGISNILEYADDFDISGIASSIPQAPIIGSFNEVTNSGDGDLNGLVGGNFIVLHNGLGTIDQVRGIDVVAGAGGNGVITSMDALKVSAFNNGSGNIDDVQALNFSFTNYAAGDAGLVFGITGSVESRGVGGSITDAYGSSLVIEASGGSIGNAAAVRPTIVITGAGSITNAIGIQFDAGLYGVSTEPGLEATGSVKGISFMSATGTGALEGDDVYALYFDGADSLQGVDDEYALYIGDTDAENWFSNGLRIGVNDDTYKIDDDNDNGAASSSPLYIGNEVIDTSVSDRRLKKNISTAETSALEFIDQFDVVQFDWLTRNDRSEYGTVPFGLIAQDVADITPVYARIPTDPDNYYSVRFGDMVPMLIKGIQEMKLEISGIQEFADETFMDRIRTWLASQANGIENIFSNRIETNELCVGSRCVTEEEFIRILDSVGVDNTSDISDEEEVVVKEIPAEETVIETETDSVEEDTEEVDSVDEEENVEVVDINEGGETEQSIDTGEVL